MGALKPLFLVEGEQTAESVAWWLANVVASARTRVDLAIYDCHLEGKAAAIFVGALRDRARAGASVRIVYNAPRAVPPEGAVAETAHPDVTSAFFAQSNLAAVPVGDEGVHLMHHKYMVVDAGTPRARVWTGSANLTMAAFTLQENNLLDIASPKLAEQYAANFEELWKTRDFDGSGVHGDGKATVRYDGEAAEVEVRFAPGQGAAIDHEVAQRIGAAKHEVTVASVVLSSGHVLGALRDLEARGVPLSGIVDGTQMEAIVAEWRKIPASAWKAEAFEAVVRYGKLHGKKSARYGPRAVHDYMHNKVIVVDDTVITGSYNFSMNAESNAENILFIESRRLARRYREYVAGLVRRYPPM